jgi:hypothetical protein
MLVPHFQQSAIINHNRTDMGAWQSGQAHMRTSPFIHSPPLPGSEGPAATLGAVDAEAGLPTGLSGISGNGSSDERSKTGRSP